MARIRDTQGRQDGGSGYARLLGSPLLGQLISRLHATAIRSGNELETILAQRCSMRSQGLQELLQYAHGDGQQMIEAFFREPIEAFFNEKVLTDEASRPTEFDVVVLDHRKQRADIIEVKDGDTFDTKKSDGELESMRRVSEMFRRRLGYQADYHFCCFNQSDKAQIISGAKGRFDQHQVMTGPELCELLRIDYHEVQQLRRDDMADNLEFLLEELVAIPEARDRLRELLICDGRQD